MIEHSSNELRAPQNPHGITISTWLRGATSKLKAANVETPALDARLLIAHVTHKAHAALIAHGEQCLSADEISRLEHLLTRRLAREPVSRLLGTRDFYGRTFQITPDVLDPRPDSETLIDVALKQVAKEDLQNKDIRILDIGTGSGCLLLTLLAELPQATGVGTDISLAALKVAEANAAALGLTERAVFQQADILSGVNLDFNLVVSNPPYIPSGDIAGLERDVFEYDPHLALNGGPDGLQLYRRLANEICSVISDGWVIVEVGCGQAADVIKLFQDFNSCMASKKGLIFSDLAGRDRVITVRASYREK